MIRGTLNPEKIRHENPTDLSTSPVRGNHFTFGNPKRVIFNSIIHTYFWLFTLSHKKQTVIHLLTPPENVTTLTCELQNFFIWLKVCCVLSNVGGSEDSQLWLSSVTPKRTGCDEWQLEWQATSQQVFKVAIFCMDTCFQSFPAPIARMLCWNSAHVATSRCHNSSVSAHALLL